MKNIISDLPFDAAFIENPIHIRYLTDIHASAGFLIITNKNSYFITDFRYIEMAEKKLKTTNTKVVLQNDLFSQICEIINTENIKKLAIEANFQTVVMAERYKKMLSCEIVCDGLLDKKMHQLREIKTEAEIIKIKKAQAITDKAFTMLKTLIREGVTEKELALAVEFFMRQNGAEAVSFDSIIVSGKNSSLPHGEPTNKNLKNGDFITMDFGCKVDGYCSDMTRTVALGFVNDEQKNVYNTVLKAQKAALSAIRAGEKCKDIDHIAREIINKAGFEGCFGHGLGHGVGIEIHEAPTLSFRANDTVLKAGMVVTVEPGIYLKGKFGVRIEDLVIVTETGCINLTKSKKELLVINPTSI